MKPRVGFIITEDRFDYDRLDNMIAEPQNTTEVKTEGLTGLMGECAAYRTEYTIFHDALKRLIDATAIGDPTQQEQAFEHAREMLRRKPIC